MHFKISEYREENNLILLKLIPCDFSKELVTFYKEENRWAVYVEKDSPLLSKPYYQAFCIMSNKRLLKYLFFIKNETTYDYYEYLELLTDEQQTYLKLLYV